MRTTIYRTALVMGLVIAAVTLGGCQGAAGPPAPDDAEAFHFIFLDWSLAEDADHYEVKHQRRMDKCWYQSPTNRVYDTNFIIRVDPHDEVRWASRSCIYVRAATERRECSDWSEWRYVKPRVSRELPAVDTCGK